MRLSEDFSGFTCVDLFHQFIFLRCREIPCRLRFGPIGLITQVHVNYSAVTRRAQIHRTWQCRTRFLLQLSGPGHTFAADASTRFWQ